MNKKILIAVPVALLALGAMSSNVFAQTEAGRQSLITQLSAKLGLPETKVQQAFDEIQSDRQKEAEKNYDARLTQLVSDGKITADQKTKLIAKHQEIIKLKQSSDWQNLSSTDRRIKMDQLQLQLDQWAKDNNIDVSYLIGFGGGRMMGGRGMHRPD